MPTTDKQFIFVHIPKTAGTTFTLALSRQFKFRKKIAVYIDKPGQSYSKYTPEFLEKFDLVFGHFPFHTQKTKNDPVYYTFLRKPRERLLSGYKYIKGDGIHGVKQKVNVADYSLKDFLKQGLVKKADNLMVRYLSGNMEKDYLTIDESDLKTAITNFDAYFSVFGLTEYFDESLVLLAGHMKWAPLYYLQENLSDYKIDKKELDEETEKFILACTKFDAILYKHADERFLKIMESKKEMIEKGLIELKEGNEKKKTILKLRNKGSLLINTIVRKLK